MTTLGTGFVRIAATPSGTSEHRTNGQADEGAGNLWARSADQKVGVMGCRVAALVAPASLPVTTASATPLHRALVTITPAGPYSSTQLVTVTLGPDSILPPGRSVFIEECSVHGRTQADWHHRCDPRTKRNVRVTADLDGSLTFTRYPVYELTDAFAPHEWTGHPPVCDLTHACVLLISPTTGGDGDRDSDDAGGGVWSLPFFVGPAANDPPPSTPEVPSVLALPVLAGGIFLGVVLLRRRRSSPTRSH